MRQYNTIYIKSSEVSNFTQEEFEHLMRNYIIQFLSEDMKPEVVSMPEEEYNRLIAPIYQSMLDAMSEENKVPVEE
jgi:hypothetical protein